MSPYHPTQGNCNIGAVSRKREKTIFRKDITRKTTTTKTTKMVIFTYLAGCFETEF